MPNYIWVKDTDGLEYAVTESAFDSELHSEVEGAEVEVDAYGVPRLKQLEPTSPNQSDNKPAWVDHAVVQGADPAEAEGLTKAELIQQYGS